jgi:hypothetical protein
MWPRQRVPGGMAGGMTRRKGGPGLACADPLEMVSLADRRSLESAQCAGSSAVTRAARMTHGAARAWWPIQSSKPARPGNPPAWKVHSFAASVRSSTGTLVNRLPLMRIGAARASRVPIPGRRRPQRWTRALPLAPIGCRAIRARISRFRERGLVLPTCPVTPPDECDRGPGRRSGQIRTIPLSPKRSVAGCRRRGGSDRRQ